MFKKISGEEYLSCEKTIGDRLDLDVLYNGNKLIEEVSKVNKNSIVVINAPAAVNIPWRDQVKAIIMGGYAGAESGNGLAIAYVIFKKKIIKWNYLWNVK